MYKLQANIQEYAAKRSLMRRWVVVIALSIALVPNLVLLTGFSLPLLSSNWGIVIYEVVSFALMVSLRAPTMQKIVSFLENKFFGHVRMNLGLSLTKIPSTRSLQDERPELYVRLLSFIDRSKKVAKDEKLVRVLGSIKRIDITNDDFELNATVYDAAGIITLSPGLLNLPDDEIESVIAHELGHIYHQHPYWGRVMNWAALVIVLPIVVCVFGASVHSYDILISSLIALVFGLFFHSFIQNLYTAQSELAADRYAVFILHSPLVFESLLKRITDTNLILFDYSRFDEWFIIGYPSAKRRIDAILKNSTKTAQ